jgi:hypothetical protein
MASCSSRIHHQLISFFVSNPRHHALPNASAFIRRTALLPNDDVLPTADASTECFEENLLPNGILLPNSAHMSVSSLYQFLVLTEAKQAATVMHYSRVVGAAYPCQALDLEGALAPTRWGWWGLSRPSSRRRDNLRRPGNRGAIYIHAFDFNFDLLWPYLHPIVSYIQQLSALLP